jgi:type II secretory pathway pseudopilin PulG
LAIVAIVAAVLLVVGVVAVGIIAAIAIPSLNRARQSGNEASAIGAMRTINSAQSTYAAVCGMGFYAPTLDVLTQTSAAVSVGFLPPEFAGPGPVVKSGYTIAMTGLAAETSPASCVGVPAGRGTSGYEATAFPIAGAGTRHFGTNTESVIYQGPGPFTMPATGTPVGAVPVQ